jgi:hypothetical protein
MDVVNEEVLMERQHDRQARFAIGQRVYVKFEYFDNDVEWLSGTILEVQPILDSHGEWVTVRSASTAAAAADDQPVAYTLRLDGYGTTVTVRNNRIVTEDEYASMTAATWQPPARPAEPCTCGLRFGQRVRLRLLRDRWALWQDDHDRLWPRVYEPAGTVFEGIVVHVDGVCFSLIHEHDRYGQEQQFCVDDNLFSVEALT